MEYVFFFQAEDGIRDLVRSRGLGEFFKRQHFDGPATMQVFKTGLVMAMVLSPLQVFVGDLHGLNTLKHQPAKVAAMEAVWETQSAVPFTLFAFPDEENRTNRFAIEIPYAASLILTHDINGEIKGLNEFVGEHPPVAPVFWSFRVMLAVGTLMNFPSWWAGWQLFLRKKNKIPKQLPAVT